MEMNGTALAAVQPRADAVPATVAGAPGTAQPPTGFDAAKAALQPEIDRFGDGDLGRHSVLATADKIASQCRVRSADLRGWAKERMDALQARCADKPAVPEPACATDPEPSGAPELIAKLLGMVVQIIAARVFCAPEVADAVALWCMGTWGVFPPANPAAGPDIFPRLNLRSPTKRCGKSTLLEVVQHAVRRPLAATDISEAAIYRSVDKWRPTLLIDEADRLFAKNKELTGIINSGYTRVGRVVRTIEVQSQGVRTFEPTTFPTFAPVALAGIGRLPSTIEDRAIRIELQRQPPGQKSQRIGLRQLAGMRDNIAPHLMAHADAIGAAMAKGVDDKEILAGLNDRDADNWRPLLGLAAEAGGDWLARAQQAARVLCRESADSDHDNEWALRQVVEYIKDRTIAAGDARRAWIAGGRKTTPRIAGQQAIGRPASFRFIVSDELAVWLMAKDDSGFSDARDTGSIKLRVARLLCAFGVQPTLRRINGNPTRGYEVASVWAVWRRYRP